ncbi:hypothetical protein [Desulforamulus aeronauticus]|uniref:Uncharacterized protein n=1 Tax=Desulforamulus aeronauticus DSM 10349 TaxID=1121421 RepID=A0A1M6VMJ3_9FIRM|nr:hypothetical protein [Desulforamulus aeronauticus]SHK82574.1 hypothetical protein SAMN02745123_03261 [Desulforamulus aeronauticus DSM 10349]
MFFRKITTKKNGKEYVYVKLIENYRQDGKVKQRVIANFGSVENLSSDRINYLIASLKKLHKEIQPQLGDVRITTNTTSTIKIIRSVLRQSPVNQAIQEIFGQKDYELIEAIILKSIAASETNQPIQEACKNLGFKAGTSLQYYNTLKRLGEDSNRFSLLKAGLKHCQENENIHKSIVIYTLQSTFEGNSFDYDLTGNMFLTQSFQKPITLMLACSTEGVPVDYQYAENDEEAIKKLSLFVDRLKSEFQGNIVVLDEHNYFPTTMSGCLIAKPMPEATVTQNQNQLFNVVTYKQVSPGKIKELKAKLAKVSAGLENLKADILLGKLTKESHVTKKAENVIKSNQCDELVLYSYEETTHSFHYEIDQAALKQKQESVIMTPWIIEGQGRDISFEKIQEVHRKTDQFDVLTDQLKIPPINIYVDYHYSPEVISGHIQLEILKTQLLGAMNTLLKGGEL